MTPKPILYYAMFSPPVRAVLMTARAIDLEFDLKPIDFSVQEHLSEAFKKINPQHTVPTLIDDGETIWDSHAIMPYIVSKYGKDHSLYPDNNLLMRAKIDQRLHFNNGVLFGAIKSFVNTILYDGKLEYQPESFKITHQGYDLLEIFLQNEYLVGDKMTIADIACIATINTIQHIVPIDSIKYPKLIAWIKQMEYLPGYDEINSNHSKLLVTRLENQLKLNNENNSKV